MNVIAVVSDTDVAVKWFYATDEAEVEAARSLVRLFGQRSISLSVLDLTRYEVGNAFLRGRIKATAEQTTAVLVALSRVCPQIIPTTAQLHDAVRLAERHRLTIYDAVYASVASSRGAQLATMDKALLKAGLGRRPSEIVAMIEGGDGVGGDG